MLFPSRSRSRVPARPARRRPALRLTALEERCNPVSVASATVNAPEANQGNLTANFTQSTTSTLTFGTTVLVAYTDSKALATGSHFTGVARSADGGLTFAPVSLPGNDDFGEPV